MPGLEMTSLREQLSGSSLHYRRTRAVSSLFCPNNVLVSEWHLKPGNYFRYAAWAICFPRSSHFTQNISLTRAFTISANHYFTSSNFLWLFENILLLLLRLSFTLAFTPPFFFSRPRLPYLDYAAGWLSQLFCMQVAVAWFFVEGRERARGSEIVPRILRENYSFSWRWGVGKEDEAALFDKLLFERDRYPRGTAVLEMWPTFLNGNGSAHYSFHCSILWLNWNEASKTLCYKVSLI